VEPPGGDAVGHQLASQHRLPAVAAVVLAADGAAQQQPGGDLARGHPRDLEHPLTVDLEPARFLGGTVCQPSDRAGAVVNDAHLDLTSAMPLARPSGAPTGTHRVQPAPRATPELFRRRQG
jgi:hypothetical protein